jgi:hypothetical protein
MSPFEKLNRRQAELLNRPIYPNVPDSYDFETLEVMDIVIDSIYSPFVSHAFNRIAGLLEGDRRSSLLRKARAPFDGDDAVSVERSLSDGVAKTVITERATGRAWRLTAKEEFKVPVITLENREADGAFRLVGRSKAGNVTPRSGADVNGWVKRDGVDAFIELSMLMAPKMPEDFRSDFKSSMTHQDRQQLFRIREILAEDGGMPGPTSRAFMSIVHTMAFDGYARWAYSKLDELVDHLKEKGAVWGEAFLEYHYDYACIVPTSDGSVALFHDNSSTCEDERAYIVRFERVDGKPSRLSLYPIGQDESAAVAHAGFVAGEAPPAFAFDFSNGTQTFNVPARGNEAMKSFRMWFTKDVVSGTKHGEVVEGLPYCAQEDEDEDDFVAPAGPAV